MLADLKHEYARALRLNLALPDDLRGVYKAFGINLPDFNGDESWELPLSARIVVDSEGVIRSLDADPDYTLRPEPEESIAVLESL